MGVQFPEIWTSALVLVLFPQINVTLGKQGKVGEDIYSSAFHYEGKCYDLSIALYNFPSFLSSKLVKCCLNPEYKGTDICQWLRALVRFSLSPWLTNFISSNTIAWPVKGKAWILLHCEVSLVHCMRPWNKIPNKKVFKRFPKSLICVTTSLCHWNCLIPTNGALYWSYNLCFSWIWLMNVRRVSWTQPNT